MAGLMGQLRERFRRTPARPPAGEIAASSIGDLLQPYIGELPLDPRSEPRYVSHHEDETIALQLYRATLSDERCKGALAQRFNATISKPIEIDAGGDAPIDGAAAEDLAEQLDRIKFRKVSRQLLYGLWYGWAVAECIWGRDGKRVVLQDLVVRSPDRFTWSARGELLLRSWNAPQGEPVPPGKFVVITESAEHDDVPYGPGLARWCFWPVWLKRHGLQFWAIALERFGSPTAIGKHPPSASPEEQKRLLSLISSLATGAGVTVPEGQEIELLESARRSGGDFEAFCRYLDQVITTVILGQSSTTDQGPWRGTAEVQLDVRDETVAADAMLLDEALNDTIARWLTAWNFPTAATPEIKHDVEPDEDLNQRAEREGDVADATGYRPTIKHVADVYGGEWEEAPARSTEGGADPPAPPAAGGAPDAGGLSAEFAGEDDANPVPGLTGRLRDEAGPLVDRWAATVRDFVTEGADSLGAVRDWIDDSGVESLGAGDVAEKIGEALVAADLSGRYDVMESPVEFATASTEHARLPFSEQIEFFRGKLNMRTAAWTDAWQHQHDRAFVVAGAARDDLLTDLRRAVDSAIADGTTLQKFREDFDGIVSKHGWSYNGGRDWRTRVIYATNMRTSYAAGRFRQMKNMAGRRPYWRYRHSHVAENPRQQHLAWDGMILRHDHPWWDTHYPPNGWGCGCYAEALSERDLKRLGKDGPDRAPGMNMRQVTVGARGPHPRVVDVPEGIDPGWAYAPGQSLMRTRLEKTLGQAPAVAAAGIREALTRPRLLDGLHREWGEWLDGDTQQIGNLFVLGAIRHEVVRGLREHDVEVDTAALSTARNRIGHALRDSKEARGQALSEADIARIPEIVARPQAVLLDTDSGALLYAFTSPDGGGRMGKIAFHLNFRTRRGKTNSFRSAGYVERYNLTGQRNVLLYGDLEEGE